ncbi:hypothetical protein BJP25_02020 [Actinokineospora bangkokensis]|uniref:DUF4393 domain-containing protein n=1 Tax=Actinokineospora bangkokensis TaxID=1193682 RepID=A0A1Q9LCT1_9PSEU|nr:hypothetical protein BJP25_02020 [Actinokineospora bangkokensis]
MGAVGRVVDPFLQVARLLPGAGVAERFLFGEPEPAPRALTAGREPLRAGMAELLERAVTESRAAARDAYFRAVVDQLLPDEARIVAALSDGAAHPLVHLVARSGRPLVENASSIGTAAGVAQPGLTPQYVTRLRHFGLVEVGGEEPGLRTQYELLLADERVRAAEERAGGRWGPKVVKEVLRLSELGRAFWAVCDPGTRTLRPA